MTKLKIAAAALLAAVALASAGVVAVGAWRPDPPRAAMPPQAGAEMKRPHGRQDARGGRARRDDRGPRPGRRSGGPAGRGGGRADRLPRWEIEPAPATTSGPDGRFTLRVPPWQRQLPGGRRADAMFPWVVASIPGYGPGWASAVRPARHAGERRSGWWKTARRSRAGSSTWRAGPSPAPDQGREHLAPPEGRPFGLARPGPRRRHPGALAGPGPVAVNRRDDGRPRRPIPPDGDRPGPAGRAARLGADDRHGPALRRQPRRDADPRPHPDSAMMSVPSWTTYYTRRFDYAAAPTRPIEGTIRDKDTGRPIAGVTPPRHGLRGEQQYLGPGGRNDDRRPGALSPHRPAQGAGLSPLHRAGQGPALHQGHLPDGGRLDRAGAARLRHAAEARRPGPRPCDRQGDRPAGVGLCQLLHVPRQSARRRVPRLQGELSPSRIPRRRWPVRDRDLAGPRGHRLPVRHGPIPPGRRRPAIKGFDPKLAGAGGFNTLPGGIFIAEYHVLAEVNPDPRPSQRRWTSRSTRAVR